ncbi:TRAP transporter large permease [Variovorax sp. J22P168]|uniref:TRAP transporter large permease n=1 Tax=Variovorax jilinensis TaxID=3053513 RepID=UPI00257608FB|nr:TRAP transporter large permease [Variovorax sp. J22P168]MDM0015109.1 TRAP transporter large permease [Variovorax sp. J22P168]
MTAAIVGFAVSFVLIFLRIPIGPSLALVGFGGLVLVSGWVPALATMAMSAQSSTMSYSLSVLPLFILMGNLVAGAGISGSLFRAAQMFMGRQRGGLAMATVLACGGFAAICGSSVATAATMSRVAIPAMRKFGYADRLSAATLAAGGTLGILIPPSVIMVIYGVNTQTHIGKLFAAGLIPGALGILGYLAAVKWVVWRDPSAAPMADVSDWSERLATLRALWPVIALFSLVMGGIYGGWFTATEAAGIGAGGAFMFALTHRSLGLKQILDILVDTALVSAAMLSIVFGAAMFVEFINLTGIHKVLESMVKASGVSPFGVILIMIGIFVVAGALMEELSMILILVPIFFPIVMSLGYDPVWFGIIVVVACEIGLIAPPIGMNLFVIRSVVPDISMKTILDGMVPFITIDLIRIILLAALPILSLWLPNLLF